MKDATAEQLKSLIISYETTLDAIKQKIKDNPDRKAAGIIRSEKGALVERMTKNLIEIAWLDLELEKSRLGFEKEKVRIPIKPEYIEKLKNREIAEWIKKNIHDFYYKSQVDIHVNVDQKFVLGVECKAYSENAMMKRILIDFSLLRQKFPKLECALLQLESQLTGDYSQPGKSIIYGSKSTHTLLSLFDVDLHIITLLEGERKVKAPIHELEFGKKLKLELLEKAIHSFQEILKKWA